MTYSGNGKYRGAHGTLTIGGGKLVFTRTDGLITKVKRVVVTIPADAVVSVTVEGFIAKRLVVLVDRLKVPGVPRHEFQVPDPDRWKRAILREVSSAREAGPREPEPIKELYVKEITREIVKIPCSYCGMLNEITKQRCSSCGAPVGRK